MSESFSRTALGAPSAHHSADGLLDTANTPARVALPYLSVRLPQKLATASTRNVYGRLGAGFTLAEIKDLLVVVKSVNTVSGENWTTLAMIHDEKWPQNSRRMAGLRWKFYNILKLAPPTGNPTCPPHVKRAKRINRMIAGGAGINEDKDDDLDLTEESLRIFNDRIAPRGHNAAEENNKGRSTVSTQKDPATCMPDMTGASQVEAPEREAAPFSSLCTVEISPRPLVCRRSRETGQGGTNYI